FAASLPEQSSRDIGEISDNNLTGAGVYEALKHRRFSGSGRTQQAKISRTVRSNGPSQLALACFVILYMLAKRKAVQEALVGAIIPAERGKELAPAPPGLSFAVDDELTD